MLIGNYLSISMEKNSYFFSIFNSKKLVFIAKFRQYEGFKKRELQIRKIQNPKLQGLSLTLVCEINVRA